MSNFSFSHSVFKKLVQQTRKKPELVWERVNKKIYIPLYHLLPFKCECLLILFETEEFLSCDWLVLLLKTLWPMGGKYVYVQTGF